MGANSAFSAKWMKSGLLALGAAAVAVPLAGAVAMAVDPTQQADTELTAEQMEQGRELFNSWSCSACHVLGDAGGNGHIGPSLDGNTAIDKDFIVARVSNGQGAMPGFGGQMSDEEIDLLAQYVMAAKR